MKFIEIKDEGLFADKIALPFWIILLSYSFWKINGGDNTAWIIVLIVGVAFIIDSFLVMKSIQNENKKAEIE
jgi:NADH:ubiquinone oxidoreductase subunit 5 (subunit L)/multisubunit Na+/H+ antiporter MnhA subunit